MTEYNWGLAQLGLSWLADDGGVIIARDHPLLIGWLRRECWLEACEMHDILPEEGAE